MSRRHAFRPAGLDLLEGRIAPSAFLAPGASTGAKVKVQVHPVAHPKSKPLSINIDWNKLGNQIQNFFGLGHKAKAPPLAHAVATAHTLRRV